MPLPPQVQMEPLLIREDAPGLGELQDLVWELGQRSPEIANSRLSAVHGAVARLVRAMNCYYSNLIEGHNTQPIEIDRALANQFEADPQQRDLQEEAKAHIEVQTWIDEENGLADTGFGVAGIREIHRRFYEKLPPHMHLVTHPQTQEQVRVIPGEYRQNDVRVGRHVPVAAADIPACLARWEAVYTNLPPRNIPLAAAAAHHRLLWIHPMLDGNGRVARLITHAMLKKALSGVELWSVSRGFARTKERYKYLLQCCDHPRRGDRDGRGQLSESSLIDFTRYFLETALDQVNFMSDVLRTDDFSRALLEWIRSQPDIAKGDRIIEHIILYGSIERGEVPTLLGLPERTARRVVKALFDHYLLDAESHRAPLKLNLPLHAAQAVFPSMVPDNAV